MANFAARSLALGVVGVAGVGIAGWIAYRRLLRGRRHATSNAVAERKREFLADVGASYGYRGSEAGFIDSWRQEEHPGLIAPLGGKTYPRAMVYLDFSGAALPAASQLRAIGAAATSSVCGNPHSSGPAAAAASAAIEAARQLVLEHFCGTRAHEWELIWTSGATSALRIAAEAFPWAPGESELVFSDNAHTSVLGMRAVAAAAGGTWRCVALEELQADSRGPGEAQKQIDQLPPPPDGSHHQRHDPKAPIDHLLVLPAECNLTGERSPVAHRVVDALSEERSRRGGHGRWHVLLDAAKAAASGPLDLPSTGASLACVSLYKIFGEPTGLGALLVRADLATLLRRDGAAYFGGGSVATVLAAEDHRVPKDSIAEALASGTAHFRGLLSVPAGFESLRRLGGMSAIAAHTTCLTTELVKRLRALRHANGQPAVVLYGPWASLEDPEDDSIPGPMAPAKAAGPTVAFNLMRHTGEFVGYSEVQKLAALHTPPIQLRGGCCCNPGGCQRILGLHASDVRAAAAAGKKCGDDFDLFPDGRPTGVVRASLGRETIWEDIDALVGFVATVFVASGPSSEPEIPRGGLALTRPTGSGVGARGCGDEAVASIRTQIGKVLVYPIKSCAAFESDLWWMDRHTGRLLLDREWALIDGRGVVMRLATYPKLALLRPEIDLDRQTLTLRTDGLTPLVLSLDSKLADGTGGGAIATPIGSTAVAAAATGCACCTDPTMDAVPSEGSRQVNVCGKDCAAAEFGGGAAARWLSSALGVHCRLVRHRPPHRPPPATDDVCTSGGGDTGGDTGVDGVAFANESPLLVLAEPAVAALNRTLRADGEAPVSARHFRPNIVLTGGHGLGPSDAGWRCITLSESDVTLRVTGPCGRCSMVEIDPTSGARHGAVLRALAKHQRVRSRLVFGVFCTPQKDASGSAALPMSAGSMIALRAGSPVSIGVASKKV